MRVCHRASTTSVSRAFPSSCRPRWSRWSRWPAPTAQDAAWRGFAGKTFETVDRLLRQQEAALARSPTDETAMHQMVTALRGQWIHQLLGELPSLTTRNLWVATRLTPGPEPAEAHIEVWTLQGRRPRLLESRSISPTAKDLDGDRVHYFDLDAVQLALAEVLRTYGRDLLNRRLGSHWRSRRRPAGWPVVTRYAIPWLYDYLRPFYGVRRYRHRRQRPSAGHYPVKLRRDIRDILRFERPELAEHLTVAHVTAAIQYHLRMAAPNRRMGKKLCAELRPMGRRQPA